MRLESGGGTTISTSNASQSPFTSNKRSREGIEQLLSSVVSDKEILDDDAVTEPPAVASEGYFSRMPSVTLPTFNGKHFSKFAAEFTC